MIEPFCVFFLSFWALLRFQIRPSDITINVTFTKINPTIDRIEIDSDSDFKKEYECLEHFSPVGMEFTIYYDSNTVADGDALTRVYLRSRLICAKWRK